MAKVERTRYALVKWISGGDGFDVLSVDTCLKHDQVLKENVLQNPTNYIGQNMEFHFNDGEETDPGLLIAIGSEKDMELKRATLREREFERLGCPRTDDNIKNIEITSILEPVETKRIRLDYATEEIIEIVNTTEAGPYEPIKKCRCKKYYKLKEKYERIKAELEIKENKIQKYKEKKSFFHKMQDLIDNNGSNITSSKANSQNHDKETNTEELISSVNRGSDDTASSLLSMSTEKFQKTVLLMLKDLSSKMDTLAKLSRNGSTAITPVDITPKIGGIFDVAFPIGYDKLKEVEELLQNNEEQKNAISIMRCWGGKDLHSIIRRALKKTFDHQLVLKMNWIGANGNVAFKRLKLKEIICAAVYQNPNLTNASELTDYDIENIMQKWLKYKGDRNGGRTQRAKRALQDGQIQQNLQSHVEDKDEDTEIDERVERIHSIERGELEKKPQRFLQSKLTENSERFGCCHLERRLPRGQYSEITESSLRGTYSLPLARSLRGGHSQPAEPSQRVRQDFILQ